MVWDDVEDPWRMVMVGGGWMKPVGHDPAPVVPPVGGAGAGSLGTEDVRVPGPGLSVPKGDGRWKAVWPP